MKRIFIVEAESSGKRLDVYLSDIIEDITRSQIKKSIDEGKTLVDGVAAKAGRIVKEGSEVEFEEAEAELRDILPENIPIDIVYEDDDIAVINKKQGMTVHPAPGNYNGTLVNALLFHFDKISDIGEKIRPGIVHRIDKDTSGLIVVAKNNQAHLSLAGQIANKTCRRIYYALCEGVFKNDSGIIAAPLCRDIRDRKKIAVSPDGKNAVTHFSVLERFEGYTLVRFELSTGRTHQIRVHAKYIGHPIVGDKTYGFTKQRFKLEGQLLHAKQLELIHPKTKQVMHFECELPHYFTKIVVSLKKSKQ